MIPELILTEGIKKVADICYITTKSYIESYREKQKQKKTKLKLYSSKNDLKESLKYHLNLVNNWSSEISFKDLKQTKSLLKTYIELQLFFTPKRNQLHKTEELNKIKLSEIFDNSKRHIVLLGQPGAGKTTSVKKICQDILTSKTFCKEDFEFPILIRIADFGYGISSKSLYIHIYNLLGLKIGNENAILNLMKEDELEIIKKTIVNFLNHSKALIIVDGYDEIPTYEIKKCIINELRELALTLNKSKLLITSRSSDFNINLENTNEFEICPLNDEQIIQFANAWFEKPEIGKQFLADIKNYSYADTLIRPVFLSLLCSIYERSGKLYDKPKTAYEKMIRLLLEEWDEQRSIIRLSKYSYLEIDRKFDFLSHLAFYLTYIENTLAFNRQTLIKAYRAIYSFFELPKNEYFEVIEELETHTGIFIQDGYEIFKFYHKSFQEFLTAKYIISYPSIPKDMELHRLPNELAIATCLQKSTHYIVELILSSFQNKITPEFIYSYINRLYIEKPTLTPDPYLALALLYVNSISYKCRIKNEALNVSFRYFFSTETFLESFNMLKKHRNFRTLAITEKYHVFHYLPSGNEKYDLKYLYNFQLKLEVDNIFYNNSVV